MKPGLRSDRARTGRSRGRSPRRAAAGPVSSSSTSFASPAARRGPSRTRPSLVDDVEPDEVGDVVACRSGSAERLAAHGELGAPHDAPVELDRTAPAPTLPRDHDRARSPSTMSSAPMSTAARPHSALDDERAVEPVRPSDAADVDEIVSGSVGNLEQYAARRRERRPRGRAAERPRDRPRARSPCRRRPARREVKHERAVPLVRLDPHRVRLVDELAASHSRSSATRA